MLEPCTKLMVDSSVVVSLSRFSAPTGSTFTVVSSEVCLVSAVREVRCLCKVVGMVDWESGRLADLSRLPESSLGSSVTYEPVEASVESLAS